MIFKAILLCFLASATPTMFGCGYATENLPKGREISSEQSPDGFSRAFIWEPKTSGFLGATTSQPYQVWIQYLGASKPEAMLLKADSTDGVRLKWSAPRVLVICYGPTNIYYLRNIFDYGEQNSQQLYRVEVILKRVEKLRDCDLKDVDFTSSPKS